MGKIVEDQEAAIDKKKEKKEKKSKDKSSKHKCDDEKQVKEKKSKKRKPSEDGLSSSDEKKKSKKSKTEPSTAVAEEPVVVEEIVEATSDEVPKHLRITSYRISDATQRKLKEKGITQLFPIQAATFDAIYDGKDVVGRARTGTGKTLSFALPIVESLMKSKSSHRSKFPRVLVMCPTRELAKQVATEFQSVCSELKILTVYGGVPYYEQERALREGIDIIVGTPGRIMDHLERKNLNLSNILFTVLDEADQMLDIGFADAMEVVLKKIKSDSQHAYQTLLFSATLPEWVNQTTKKYLRQDNMITIDLVKDQKLKTNENIKHFAIQCSWHQRKSTLGDIIRVYGTGTSGRTIIFTDTKAEANEIALGNADSMAGIDCQVLHGDIAQKQREITLQGFREGKFKVLVATDVAARGLDIPEVDLVVQSNLPKDIDTFVHRSGRTGRAGKKGVNIVFYKPMEEWNVGNIERKLGLKFERIGAPQPDDIIKAKVSEALKALEKVDDRVLPVFAQVSRDLLSGDLALETINVETKEEQIENMLARALAALTGITKPPPVRSVLTCREGQICLSLKVGYEIRSSGYIRAILSRQFPEIDREAWTAFRMLKDATGAVFDFDTSKMPVEELMKQLKERVHNNANVLEIVRELPELQESAFQTNSSPTNNCRAGSGYGNNNRGGYQGGRFGNNRQQNGGNNRYSKNSWNRN